MSEMLNELKVLNDVRGILSALSKDEQRRSLEWLMDYFDIYDRDFDFDDIYDYDDDYEFGDDIADGGAANAPLTFEGVYNKVEPKTAIQKIVTAAWWLERQEGKESWKSFEVNKLLKSLDVKISSVSGTLAIENKKDDSMIVVLEKSGDSMQARKTFRLSDAGYAFVDGRLA